MDENAPDPPPPIVAEPPVIEAPEPPHQHQHSGNPWFDRILAVSVVVASFASLYVSLHTGQTMEALVDQNARLVRANSTPLLVWSHGNLDDDGDRSITFELTNAGTGPARISWLELRHDGKAHSNLRDHIAAMGGPEKFSLTYTSSIVTNTMLSAGQKVVFVRYPFPKAAADQKAWDALDRGRWKLEATACYCSLLNECWTSHLQADVPQPVKACDATGRNSINDSTKQSATAG
jgi:hypothetical protein